MDLARSIFAALAAFPLLAVSSSGQEPTSEPAELKCDIGPVSKTYGKTEWMVYSCNDRRTLTVISAPGNPAMPFYFVFLPEDDGYRIQGEGTGRQETTTAAYDELKALTAADIAALIAQTAAVKK